MRRVVGLTLAGLGACLAAVAILLPTYAARHVVRWPLNEYQSFVLDASGATDFSVVSLAQRRDVTVQAVYTLKGDALLGTSSTAVWDEFDYVHDLTTGLPVRSGSRVFAFDRRTAGLVDCCGVSINGDMAIQQGGLSGFAFPVGTAPQDYLLFDTTLDRPEPCVYAGLTTVHGISAYVFTQDVPPTRFATQTVPGAAVGARAPSVTQPEYYQVHASWEVDPETGAVLGMTQHQIMTLRNPVSDTQDLVMFDANLVATNATVDSLVRADDHRRAEARTVRVLLPIITGGTGGVALLAGIVLARGQAAPEAVPEADTADGAGDVTPTGAGPREDSR
jgi:hypothetical protein